MIMHEKNISILLLSWLPFIISNSPETFQKRCGDCWCIPEGVCPSFEDGYQDYLPDSEVYNTFQLENPDSAPILQDSAGDKCYPFTSLLTENAEKLKNFPESKRPQCQSFEKGSDENAVCAFLLKGTVTDYASCSGRKYEMKTFDSREAALAEGAQVTHERACGVCSTAQDLSTMSQGKQLDKEIFACAVSYFISSLAQSSTSFQTLVTCIEDIGFSNACAELWAHSSATTSYLCQSQCSTDALSNVNNLPPPECKLTECVQCKEGYVDEAFELLSGRTFKRSGLTENIAYPCKDFSKIVHDPCDDLSAPTPPTGSPTTGSPTTNTSGGNLKVKLDGLTIIMSALLLLNQIAI